MFLRNRLTKAVGRVTVASAAIASLFVVFGFTGATSHASKPINPNATLIVAISSDPGQMDPRLNHSVVTIEPVWHMYEGLLMKDWMAGDKSVHVIPVLAQSYTISKNGTIYTFRLRKGVKFQDGTPFNAAAVEFNFRVLLDKTFQYFFPAANTYVASRLTDIASYKDVSPYVFQITLTHRDGNFVENFATMNELSIVSPKAIATYGNPGISTHPVGTGPFSFVSYSPGQNVVLTRNASYWKGPSKIKTLVFRIIADLNARTAALEAHEVHVAENVSVQDAARWTGRKDIRVVTAEQPTVLGCLLNFRQGPTTNKLFREAMNLAINRAEINQIVFSGKATSMYSFFGPGSGPAYNPKLPKYPFNPSLAKKLLAQAGYSHGANLYMEQSAGNQNSIDALTIAQQNLAAVGINLKFDVLDQTTWLKQLGQGIDTPNINGMCLQGLGNESSVQGFTLFDKAGWPPNGFNTGFFTDPALEAAATAGQNAPSQAAYVADLRKADSIVNKDYAVLVFTSSPKINGVVGNVVWQPAASRLNGYYNAKVYK